ncbi:MAG TPA: nucleoside recognition domain-containing protein [Thermoanaerobaculia bacterium]|nr:nucleoside recognition domain-containing protein [Thermoanaerobaculia bacterium]
MLNKIWGGFFLAAFMVALGRWLVLGEAEVWAAMVGAIFEMAGTGFEIALGLTGVMCLWLGVMRLGEAGGAVDLLARAFAPLLRRLFRGVPEGHPAMGAMVMNMAANMLGLDNAATPLGLKAMRELQSLNPEPERATDEQVLFLVVNTSAVTLIPATIFVYRAQLGAADPTDVFIPLLLATFCSTLVGLLAVAAVQRLRLWDPVVLAYLGGLTALVAGIVLYFTSLEQAVMEAQSSLVSNFLIFLVIIVFLTLALWRRVPVFETFVEGAKEGFGVAVQIIPYLVAMLVAIGVLRASGTLDLLLEPVRLAAGALGLDTRWIDGLPTALMRPLSGSGARGMLIETMETHGADSFAGRLASVIQGSTETTFYVLAVYFGAVGIKNTRQALPCGLAADAAGILAAILVSYLFFG